MFWSSLQACQRNGGFNAGRLGGVLFRVVLQHTEPFGRCERDHFDGVAVHRVCERTLSRKTHVG